MESLQNRSLHKVSGEQVYYIYYYDLKEYIARVPSNKIVFDPAPYVRSAEKCYDCYSYAHGKFRWGDTKIYSSPTATESHRVCLSPRKCSLPECWPQASATPENQEEAFHELRLAVEYDRVSNPLVTGAVNINGIVHTHTGNRNQEFDPDAGMISGVTSFIPAAPPKPRVKPISVLWGSLKRT